MGKQRTVHGKYSSDDMGKDKVVEMDKSRTKNFTHDDGKSLASELDWTPKRENLYPHDGMSGLIKRKR